MRAITYYDIKSGSISEGQLPLSAYSSDPIFVRLTAHCLIAQVPPHAAVLQIQALPANETQSPQSLGTVPAISELATNSAKGNSFMRLQQNAGSGNDRRHSR